MFIRPDPVEARSSSDAAVLLIEHGKFPGGSVNTPGDIDVDSSGNSYITGSTREASDCCGNGFDVYVSKVNSSGNIVWTKVFETVPGGVGFWANSGDDEGKAITVDSSGNVYITGLYRSTVDFDPGPGTMELTNSGDGLHYDIFIVKLDSSGNLVWAKSVGVIGRDYVEDIAVDSSGNVYVTGFIGRANNDFDPGPGTVTLPFTGDWVTNGSNAFILKLDSSGNYVWAKSLGGTDPTPQANAQGHELAIDSSGFV